MADLFFENAPQGSVVPESKATDFYNCIAWAVRNEEDVIWPDEDEQWGWPPQVERQETLAALQGFFLLSGFKACGVDTKFQEGLEKVALYVLEGRAKHAARQLPSGRYKGQWTSKLGGGADVRHSTAEALQGKYYGMISSVMARPFDGKPPKIPALHPPRARLVSPTGKILTR